MKITEVYNGQEFEIIIGWVYEFSNNFNAWDRAILKGIDIDGKSPVYLTNYYPVWFHHIRPVQPKEVKPLTADELYRICGKNGYEVKLENGNYGVNVVIKADGSNKEITHYRKAFTQDDWLPIAEIEREA